MTPSSRIVHIIPLAQKIGPLTPPADFHVPSHTRILMNLHPLCKNSPTFVSLSLGTDRTTSASFTLDNPSREFNLMTTSSPLDVT